MEAEFLNTLYVTTDMAQVKLDHDTVRVISDNHELLRIPLLHLSGIVVFGNVMVSPGLLYRLSEEGKSLVYLSRSGRFVARVEGPVSGNVLLRQAQFRGIDDRETVSALAKMFVGGKIQNSRAMLQRSTRDTRHPKTKEKLTRATDTLASVLTRLDAADDLDEIRGLEGEAAKHVFNVFDSMMTRHRDVFAVTGRNRRPPLDRTNALLSFLYALLAGDCSAALESCGLDPQAGFLHALRPGRPALTLDLMEEFRPVLADRLVVTLVNREQIVADDFVVREGGAVRLTDDGRKKAIIAYQTRKAEEVSHALLKKSIPLGVVPHVQARLLARHLRGDTATYVPFQVK